MAGQKCKSKTNAYFEDRTVPGCFPFSLVSFLPGQYRIRGESVWSTVRVHCGNVSRRRRAMSSTLGAYRFSVAKLPDFDLD
jgi:hypothetical protein